MSFWVCLFSYIHHHMTKEFMSLLGKPNQKIFDIICITGPEDIEMRDNKASSFAQTFLILIGTKLAQ